MATIKSIFGAYSDRLQVVIDKSLDKFAPTWFQNYFDWAPPQQTLNFTHAIGKSRIEAAASVIARGSTAPLRSRQALEKLSGQVPPITEKFQMTEEEYRGFLTLQQMSVDDNVKKQMLLDMLFNDVKNVGNAAMKRLDLMVLEGISTGQITLTTTNNPDGVVAPTAIDLLMPSGNKTNAAVNWATSATATPFTDIRTVVSYQKARGVNISKIMMSDAAWLNLIKTTEVKDLLAHYLRMTANKVMPTLDSVNEFMRSHRLPQIEIVDVVIGIEKNGTISTIRPFKDENVVFVPDGKLGLIYNAVSIEQLKPVEKVSYGVFNRALISKWQENEPWAEYTKVELNAFPGINVDGIHILSSNVAF